MCVAGLLIDVLQLFSARLMTGCVYTGMGCATTGSPKKHAAKVIPFVSALGLNLMTNGIVLTLISIYTHCLGLAGSNPSLFRDWAYFEFRTWSLCTTSLELCLGSL